MISFHPYIQYYEKEFLRDLADLVKIPSVADCSHASKGAPFGANIRHVFDCFLAIAEKCGLETADFDGYACHAGLGTSSEYIGVLGHLDIVESGDPDLWHSNPFTLAMNGGILYGRGVNDDKGPLLACLYALRILKEMGLPLKRSIRVIAGGAEETTWACMDHYFKQNPQPLMGFSPDGNFPIVNGEKGILKYDLVFPLQSSSGDGGLKLTAINCSTWQDYVCDQVSVWLTKDGRQNQYSFHGQKALSRNPARGCDAIWKFAGHFKDTLFAQNGINQMIAFINTCLIDDHSGKKCGLFYADAEMGTTSLCPTGIQIEDDSVHLYLDIRYPKTATASLLSDRLGELAVCSGFEAIRTLSRPPLYVPPTSPLITCLSAAYQEVTGETAVLLSKGGASYARTLTHGVSFGASFEGEEPRSHFANECIPLSSLKKAMEIYCRAIFYLSGH